MTTLGANHLKHTVGRPNQELFWYMLHNTKFLPTSRQNNVYLLHGIKQHSLSQKPVIYDHSQHITCLSLKGKRTDYPKSENGA